MGSRVAVEDLHSAIIQAFKNACLNRKTVCVFFPLPNSPQAAPVLSPGTRSRYMGLWATRQSGALQTGFILVLFLSIDLI